MIKKTMLSVVAVLLSSVTAALATITTPIAISPTNFTTLFGAAPSTTQTATGHAAYQYAGSKDFLIGNATFDLNFTTVGADETNIGLWFRESASAEVLFVGANPNRLRNRTGYNVATQSGGSTATPASGFSPGAGRLVVDRVVNGTSIALNYELFDTSAASIITGTINYTAAGTEEWGINYFIGGVGASSVVVNSLTVSTVPEPTSLALLGLGLVGLLSRGRRRRV